MASWLPGALHGAGAGTGDVQRSPSTDISVILGRVCCCGVLGSSSLQLREV